MTRNIVGWFEIYTSDLPRAQKFYESVFQVRLEKLPTPAPEIEMLQFPGEMNAGGANGALCRMEGFQGKVGGTLVYFSCEDCAEAEARVVPAGGQIAKPKMSIGDYGFISLVMDTEGNMIGLHSMK